MTLAEFLEEYRKEKQVPKPLEYVEKSFEEINSHDVGKVITTQAVITHVTKPTPSWLAAVFECRYCMRLYEVEHKPTSCLREPAVCQECGGRSFKVLPDESKFQDTQELTISTKNTTKTMKITLVDGDTSYDLYRPNQEIKLEGQLKVIKTNSDLELHIHCFNIQVIQDLEPLEENCTHPRDSEEYKQWRQEVLQRDITCQACGGTKKLEVHHLFNYKEYPERRVEPGNGIVLCSFCHKKFHSYYGKQVTPVDLVKFIHEFGR